MDDLSTSVNGQENLIFSIDEKPFNKTYKEWVIDWANWHLSIPDMKESENKTLAHPRDFFSSEKCSINQNPTSPVWFLADGRDTGPYFPSYLINPNVEYEERRCTIPQGKALLVQIVGSVCGENEGLKTDQEFLDCGYWVLDKAEFFVKIDGKEIINTIKNPNDKQKYFIEPFYTNLTYVANNYYGVAAGEFKGMLAGYYLFVRPLPPGEHTIEFKEDAVEFDGVMPISKRQSHVLYVITVK